MYIFFYYIEYSLDDQIQIFMVAISKTFWASCLQNPVKEALAKLQRITFKLLE